MRIFLHSISLDELDPRLGQRGGISQDQVDEYAQRAILLASPDDHVILNRHVDPAYLEYLTGLGFGLGRHLVPAAAGTTLVARTLADSRLVSFLEDVCRGDRAASLHPYLSGEPEAALARRIGAVLYGPTPSLSRDLNNKVSFRSMLGALGLPVANGIVATGLNVMPSVKDFLARYGAVVVRGEHSCGGSSAWVIRDEQDLATFRDSAGQMDGHQQYLVEQFYAVTASPNLELYVSESGVRDIGLSDQILGEGLSHEGNQYFAGDGIADVVRTMGHRICEHLRKLGYLGDVGIDFIVTGERTVIPVELNARVNTSLFAFSAMQKIFGAKAGDRRFKLLAGATIPGIRDFERLKDRLGNSLLQAGHESSGVFPYNVGVLNRGKCDVLMVGDNRAQIVEFERALFGEFATSREGTHD